MLFSKIRMIVLTISGSFWLAPSIMAILLGARASRERLAASVVFSQEGRPTLLEPRRDFADYLDAAFAPIRAAAREDILVTTRIVWGYETLARLVDDDSERKVLSEGLDGLRADVETHFSAARDREKLIDRLDRVRAAL